MNFHKKDRTESNRPLWVMASPLSLTQGIGYPCVPGFHTILSSARRQASEEMDRPKPWTPTAALAVAEWSPRFLLWFTRLLCCRSSIALPPSCPRPVHVHQIGCSLIHRSALWKTRPFEMEKAQLKQWDGQSFVREIKQAFWVPRLLSTSSLTKGIVEYQ